MEEIKSDIVSSVLADYQEAWRSKRVKEELFMDIYRRYRSYLDIDKSLTRSQLFIPESFSVVETVAPRMTARKPTLVVLPRSSENIESADRVGKLLDYQMDRMEFLPKIKRGCKQTLMYGTGFYKVGWDADKQMPALEAVDVADIFGDPSVFSWDKGYIIHRYYATYDELKNSSIKYTNLEKLQEVKKSQPKDDFMRQQRLAAQGVPTSYEYSGFECLEWWGFVDGKVRVRTIGDRSVVLRDDPTPFALNELPFIPQYDQEVPFDKWGIGEIEPIIPLQDEENTTRNQRIDEKNLSVHNMWVVSKTSGIDYQRLQSKPGGIILANDINAIKPLEKQMITSDTTTEVQMIKADIQNTTGVNDYIRGSDTGTTTATEVASKTQESNQRFAEKVANLEITLKKIGQWMVALNAQFMTKEMSFRVQGKYGFEEQSVSMEDIKGQYDIDIETGSSLPANPELRRQQLISLITTVTPILTNPNGIPDGMRELMRLLIQSFEFKNTDEILQGAEHPDVNMAMANLTQSELQGTNPQLVQQEIKRRLMAQGGLRPMNPMTPEMTPANNPTQLPAIPTL